MSEPFQAVATCLGGALPRDVIRFARQLAITAGQGDSGLAPVTRRVVADEIAGKARAALVIARRFSDAEASPQILGWLHQLECAVPECALDTTLCALEGVTPLQSGYSEDTESERNAHRELRALARETSAWLYHADAVLDVFTTPYDETRHREVVTSGIVDRLAAARQDLATSAIVSWHATSAERAKLGVRVIAPPSWV